MLNIYLQIFLLMCNLHRVNKQILREHHGSLTYIYTCIIQTPFKTCFSCTVEAEMAWGGWETPQKVSLPYFHSIFAFIITILLVLEFHINGSTLYVLFRVCLFLLSIVFLRFVLVSAWISNLFFFIPDSYSVEWISLF